MKQLTLTEEQWEDLESIIIEGLVVKFLGESSNRIRLNLEEGDLNVDDVVEIVGDIEKVLNRGFGTQYGYKEVSEKLGWYDQLQAGWYKST